MKPTRHRILYTGDCNYLFANDYAGGGAYTAKVIHDHIDLLADHGVDTYLANPNGQVPWYPSRAVDSMLAGYTRGNAEFFRSHYPPLDDTFTQDMLEAYMRRDAAMLDRYLDLVEAGVDWLAEMASACRRRGMSPWLTIRMNDAHGANSWEHSYFNCPPQRDPRFRLSARHINPRKPAERYMTVCNWAFAEVRDYYLAMIREVVEEYAYEGIELDWLRTPACCEPPASQDEVDMMLEWMGELRAMTQRRAKALGKPYFVGLRIPCRLGALRTIGLDVPAMARRGLIDFISPSNTWQTTWDVPYDRLRGELTDDVAIYGVIEDAPNWMFARNADGSAKGYRLLSTSAALLRGNAAGKLAMGADGIELFNFFCSDSAGVHPSARKGGGDYVALRRLDDLPFLRTQPQHYALASSYNYWAQPFYEFADQTPATVERGAWRTFGLSLAALPDDSPRQATVQIILERNGDAAPELGVSLSGSWPLFTHKITDRLLLPTGVYTHHIPEHVALNYTLDPKHLRDGWNEIIVYHGDDCPAPTDHHAPPGIRIMGIELALT